MTTPNLRLKEARAELGLTQRETATALGVNPSYYSDLENDRRKITTKFSRKFRATFGVSSEWIMTGNGEKGILKSNQKVYPENVPYLSPSKGDKESKSNKESAYSNSYPNDYWNESNFYLQSNFEKKLLLDIRDNYPEISELYFSLNDLGSFQFVIENLHHYYFNKAAKQFHSSTNYLVKGKFDYERFKNDYFKELEKLDNIKPAIVKIAAAIREFYKEMKPFDTENIIEGYFTGEFKNIDEDTKQDAGQ